jgi:hypothetical protein
MNSSPFKPYYHQSWAVLIGIDEYEHAGPLSYAVNDCDSVRGVLMSDLGFPAENIAVLRNHEATRQRIIDAYTSLIDLAVSPDDRFMFFYAGHGLTRSGYAGPVGYLLPHDGSPDRAGTLIRWDELTRNADLIQAKHLFFVLDACFSGLALRRVAYPTPSRFLSEILQRRSRQVITAGKADQVVADGGGPEGRNSIFTGFLLEGLMGAAATPDGLLTANSLMHFVYHSVGRAPGSQQTPHYGYFDGDGDFVFVAPGQNLSERVASDVIIPASKESPPSEESPHPLPVTRPSFREINNYTNPSDPNFGRNEFSAKLTSLDFDGDREEIRSLSWLSLVIEPASSPPQPLDLNALTTKYKNYTPQGDSPQTRLRPPSELLTTMNAICLKHSIKYNSPNWAWYIRIEKSGAIELCDGYHTFFTYRDMRAFRYVQIIGLAWQFSFFARDLLAEAGFTSGARLLVNLIGTRDTILADFAKAKGKDGTKWLQPGEQGYLADGARLLDLKCPDPNLQLEYSLVLDSLTDDAALDVIRDLAQSLGLAYNHQSEPRCFVHGTETFPWDQYFSIR